MKNEERDESCGDTEVPVRRHGGVVTHPSSYDLLGRLARLEAREQCDRLRSSQYTCIFMREPQMCPSCERYVAFQQAARAIQDLARCTREAVENEDGLDGGIAERVLRRWGLWTRVVDWQTPVELAKTADPQDSQDSSRS